MDKDYFPGVSAAPPRAKAFNGAGALAMFQGDYDAAKAFLEEGLASYRKLGDDEGVASCLTYLGYTAVLRRREDIPVADLLDEALRLRPRLQDPATVARMLVFAGLVAGVLRHDWHEATARHEEALALFREVRDTQGTGICLYNLGLLALIRGNNARAKTLLRELMLLARELGSKVDGLHAFFGLACVAASEGRPVRAARLWGASEAIQEDGYIITPATYASTGYEDRVAEARARLGDAEFERSWAVGKAMTRERAVEYALADETEPSLEKDAAGGERPTMLTRREEEVAALVASGLTNRRIAEELSISGRTVDTHVARVLKKLGLRSRAQIAAQATVRCSRGDGWVAR